MFKFTRNKTSLYSALLYTISAIMLIVAASLQFTPELEASSTKMLKGIMYKTPSGDIVEVVEVPEFGKCLITSVMMYCK